MSLPSSKDAQDLETMIDRLGLYEVLSMIEAICAEKADHIRSSYDDVALAAVWDKAGAAICEASSGQAVQGVSQT